VAQGRKREGMDLVEMDDGNGVIPLGVTKSKPHDIK
jgi:hypothetical protein